MMKSVSAIPPKRTDGGIALHDGRGAKSGAKALGRSQTHAVGILGHVGGDLANLYRVRLVANRRGRVPPGRTVDEAVIRRLGFHSRVVPVRPCLLLRSTMPEPSRAQEHCLHGQPCR
jgi:hypothetical protein